ncbi:hypothetical protein KUF69_23695 [Streptomyces sp. BV129]|nr:hypothetical protein [Streptomyces sp. BV129]
MFGSYLRFPADLLVAGRRVVLRLRVRRFTREDVSCVRSFVEQVAGLTRRYSQRTERMRSVLAEVGLALAGRAGARLAGGLRGEGKPEYGPAAGRRPPGTPATGRAGGRRRRVRHAKRPRLRDCAGRRRDSQAD